MTSQGEVSLNYCWCLLFRDGDNKFTEGGWSQLLEAVEQRNSTDGMSQLELVGEPTMDSDEESDEGSGESEEEANEPDTKQQYMYVYRY